MPHTAVAVAIEQTGTENTDQDDDTGGLGLKSPFGGAKKGEQGEHAAFPLVGGPGDEAEVFKADHHDEGPEHERERAKHIQRHTRGGLGMREALFEGVKRTGADVTENHTQGHEGEVPTV